MVTVTLRRSSVAVAAALAFGSHPSRLMAMRVHFPDIGQPVPDSFGFLRYPGEPIQGDAEPVLPGPTSDHNL